MRIEKIQIDASMPVSKLQQQAGAAIKHFQNVESAAANMVTTLQKLAFAKGKNQLRNPSPEFGRQGIPIDAARAQEIYSITTDRAAHSIRDELLAINQLHEAQHRANVTTSLASTITGLHAQRTAITAQVTAAATATAIEATAVNEVWKTSLMNSADANAVLSTRLQTTLKDITAANAAVTPYALVLEKLGIKNSNIGKSVSDWNLLSTLRSPGVVVTAIDRLRLTFAGIIPPIRQVTYAIQNFAVPALGALGVELHKGNPFAQRLGKQLLKMADDIQHVGKTTKTVQRSLLDYLTAPLRTAGIALRRYSQELRNSESAQTRLGESAKRLRSPAAMLQSLKQWYNKPRELPKPLFQWEPETRRRRMPNESAMHRATANAAWIAGKSLAALRTGLIGTSTGAVAFRAAIVPAVAILLTVPGAGGLAAGTIWTLAKSLFTVTPAGAAAVSALGAIVGKLAGFAFSVRGAFTIGSIVIWRNELWGALKSTAAGMYGWLTSSNRLQGASRLVSQSIQAAALIIRGPFKAALFVGKNALAGFVSGLMRAATIATFGFAAPLGSAVFGLGRFAKGMRGADVNSRSAAAGMGVFKSSLMALAPMIAGVGVMAALVMGTINTVKKGFTLAAELEQSEVAFSTMLGSADKAKQTMQQIAAFSAKTPFQMPDLVEMGRTLLAAGTAADQLVPTMRVVGDVASATNTPIGEMAEIYTKIKLQGKAGLEEIQQLARRGVPIYEELGKVTGKSRTELVDMISEGKIGIPEIQKSFVSLTSAGGKFANMMDKQSETIGGLWSTLMDNVNLTAVAVADTLGRTFNFRGVLKGAIGFTGWIRESVQSAAGWITFFGNHATNTITPVFNWITSHAGDLQSTAFSVFTGIGGMLFELRGTIAAVSSAGIAAFSALATFFGFAGEKMGGTLRELAGGTLNFAEIAQTALWAVEFGFRNWKQVGEWALVSMEYRLVAFGNMVGHFLTKQVPEYLAWFSRNWYDVFWTSLNWLQTVTANIGRNLGELYNAIIEFFNSGNWDFKWTPLTQGFENTIRELPKILDREMSPFEKKLKERSETLGSELGGDFEQFIKGKQLMQQAGAALAKLPQPGDHAFIGPVPKAGLDPLKVDERTAEELANAKGKGRSGNDRNEMLTAGSTKAFSAIAAFRDGGSKKTAHQQKVEQNQKDQNKALNRANVLQGQQVDVLNKIQNNLGNIKVANI